MQYNNLPKVLLEKAAFCLWRYETPEGRTKPTKVPCKPNGKHAQSTNIATFTDYASALAVADKFDGLGISLFGGFGAVDIDHCIMPDGTLTELGQAVMDIFEGCYIRNVVIEELVLDDLQQVVSYVKEHERDFIAAATKSSEKRIAEDLRTAQKEYEQGQTRIATLDKIMRKLYEDRVMEKISEERFCKMSADYEAEQKSLVERAAALKQTLDAAKEQNLNIDRFLKIVRKYTEITVLSGEIIRDFIEKIIVYKAEKVDGVRTQRIQIIYNCIGAIDFPKMDEKTA